MAKAAKAEKTTQADDLGSLPPELLVDGQASASLAENEPPADSDLAAGTDEADEADDADEADEANDADEADEAEDDSLRHVVVLKGNTVRHNGESYGEYSKVTMDSTDAERLIRLGKVADLRTLRSKAAAGQPGVVVTGS